MSSQTENALTVALTNHLVDEGLLHEGEFLGDWIANVHLPSVEDRDGSAYSLVMASGSLPEHVALGLLSNALDRVRGIGAYEDDE